jgi:vacuolar-type H+-ATPase subunit I/STV1
MKIKRRIIMPTGYTSKISEGISFNDFVLDCARAFGACITMRDEPMDKEIPVFKPDPYHKKQKVALEKEFEKVSKMTLEEAEIEAEAEYQSALKDRQETIAKEQELLRKYQIMLAKCQEWEPPTKDHVNLKDFMIRQITNTIKWDCDVSYYEEKKLVKLNGREWLTDRIEDVIKDIKYHTEKYEEEEKRTKGRNEWISKLKESLV